MKVLLSKNMTAVNHHAHLWFQNSIWPRSQTSRTSGWRRQNSLSGVRRRRAHAAQGAHQRTNDVYSTIAATTTVKIRPGTRPRTEYDQGNDMMARQMYSENSKAAVWAWSQYWRGKTWRRSRRETHTLGQLQVRYLMALSASSSICFPTERVMLLLSSMSRRAGLLILLRRRPPGPTASAS